MESWGKVPTLLAVEITMNEIHHYIYIYIFMDRELFPVEAVEVHERIHNIIYLFKMLLKRESMQE